MEARPYSVIARAACALLLLVLTLPTTSSFAQETTSGTIEGTVMDADGVPLPGVTVTITSSQGPRTKTTGADGRFFFPQLPSDKYGLRVLL